MSSRMAYVSGNQENAFYRLTATTESLIFDYYLDAIDLLPNNKTISFNDKGSPKSDLDKTEEPNQHSKTCTNANKFPKENYIRQGNIDLIQAPHYSLKDSLTDSLQEFAFAQANLGVKCIKNARRATLLIKDKNPSSELAFPPSRNSHHSLTVNCGPVVEGLVLTGSISNILISGGEKDSQKKQILSNLLKPPLFQNTKKEPNRSNASNQNRIDQKAEIHSVKRIKDIKPADLLNEVLSHRTY